VIDATSQKTLQVILRREGRSLLQYVRDSFPWITLEERTPLQRLRQLIDAESADLAELSQYMFKNRVPPSFLGSYPLSFTSHNFVSLDYLVPQLTKDEKRSIAALEADLHTITDPGAGAIVQKMIDSKRRHLPILEGLVAKPQAAAS
jgi:hypothetical protein